MLKKKSAWTDLEKVSFKKFVKESNVEIKKSAWTGLDKDKKGFINGKCLFTKSLHDWSQNSGLTRGAVDATPFAVAFSLTFSLVKK
jgi:hypothetical protein